MFEWNNEFSADSNNKVNNLANQKFCDSVEITNRSRSILVSMLNKFLPVSLKNIFISLDLTTKHESLGFRFCQKAVRFTGDLWCFFGVVRKKQSKDILTGRPTSLGDLGSQYFLLWGGDLKLSKRLDLKRFCRPLDSFSWSLVCWWLWLHNARLKKSSGDCENTQSSPAGKTSNPDESSDMMPGTTTTTKKAPILPHTSLNKVQVINMCCFPTVASLQEKKLAWVCTDKIIFF